MSNSWWSLPILALESLKLKLFTNSQVLQLAKPSERQIVLAKCKQYMYMNKYMLSRPVQISKFYSSSNEDFDFKFKMYLTYICIDILALIYNIFEISITRNEWIEIK